MQKEELSPLSEEQKLEQARKISVKEGAFSSMMDGFGLRYISAYALAVGATNSQIALLSAIPGLIGNFFQLATLKLIKKMPRKKIVFWSVFIQSLMWLPLILVGWLYFFKGLSTTNAASLVILLYTFLIIVGSASHPAWSSWMKDILSADKGVYFSNRNKIITAVVLSSMLLGGAILKFFEGREVFFGFAIIFTLAFIGRSIAAYLFTKKYEPKYQFDPKSEFTLLDFLKRFTKNNFGRFVIFIALISFSTAIAGPFFTVYMLRELQLDYFSFTLIILSPVVATLVFLPIWGKFSDKHGNVKILKITSYLIPTIPLLWMLSPILLKIGMYELVFYLFVLEIYSGFAWAGFNHASSTFIYEAVSKEKMPCCVSYFNIITSFGVFIGAILGGFLASFNSYPLGLTAIFATFITSGLLRLLSALIFLPLVKEVKPIEPFSLRKSIKSHFKEKTAMLTTQFWKLVGFKPIRIQHMEQH